jgi:hypothetical protein
MHYDAANGRWSLANGVSPSYKFEVNGDIYATANIIAFSDQSVKSNVQVIINPLAKVLNMRGVTYNRNDHEDQVRVHVGVIAQEMEKVLPEVVFEDLDGKKAVAYQNIVAVLIEAIKEQQLQINELRATVEKLK